MHNGGMDGAWFKTRLRSLGKTQTDLAVAIHRDRSVVSKMLGGQPSLKLDQVRPFADVLQVPIFELLYRAGLRWGSPNHPIVAPILSSIQAGQFADMIPDEPPASAENILVEHHRSTVFGLRVEGDSMDRVAPPTSIIVVDYADKDPRDGEVFAFRRAGEATLKRYRRDDRGAWLEPCSMNPRHGPISPGAGEEIEVIGRIIEIRLRNLDE